MKIKKVLDILPIPFWVYFLSILAGTTGILPHQSPAYDWITRHVLPVAILLMLIGTPLTDLLKMGPQALRAMAIATSTIFLAQVIAFILLSRFLPEDGWKSVGALMGTWIGGSANMVAVKEILQLPDNNLSALVIVDTVLSYTWMALLLSGASFQTKFDSAVTLERFNPGANLTEKVGPGLGHSRTTNDLMKWFVVLGLGFFIGEICVWIGNQLSVRAPFLPATGWTLLTASTAALLLALTPLRNLKMWGAQKMGTLLLYLVLITIGAKTSLKATFDAPVFLVYGAIALMLHGVFSLLMGKILRIPLFLLSTASQANVGGAVSAPIVAEAYRPGTAHIGVLMAILGAVLGTYLGVAGGYFCRGLSTWLR